MQLRLDGTHQVTPLVQTPFTERNGEVSPDGRWLAYEANDSGSFEIYVRPFPDVASGRRQVSTGGGRQPLWARNGQELFYLASTGTLMRVGVTQGAADVDGDGAREGAREKLLYRRGQRTGRSDVRHRRPTATGFS